VTREVAAAAEVWIFIPGLLRSLVFVVYLLFLILNIPSRLLSSHQKSNSNELHQYQPTNIRSSQRTFVLVNKVDHHITSPVREHLLSLHLLRRTSTTITQIQSK
jgi:hypothetical protein